MSRQKYRKGEIGREGDWEGKRGGKRERETYRPIDRKKKKSFVPSEISYYVT